MWGEKEMFVMVESVECRVTVKVKIKVTVKVKVQFTLQQVTKAQRGSRGRALLVL
jgi:hypothetical protein